MVKGLIEKITNKDKIEDLEIIIDNLNRKLSEEKEKNDKSNEQVMYLTGENRRLENTLALKNKNIEEISEALKNERVQTAQLDKLNNDLKQQIKTINGSKGGLVKQVNKLTRELEEVKKQLAESMTDKYLVRKIKSGKAPKTSEMKIKGSVIQSKAIKLVKEKC